MTSAGTRPRLDSSMPLDAAQARTALVSTWPLELGESERDGLRVAVRDLGAVQIIDQDDLGALCHDSDSPPD